MTVIFGTRWLVAVPMIQIVAFSWIFGFPRSLVGPILRADGKQAMLVRYAAFTTLYMLVAAFVTGPMSAVAATVAFCLRQVFAMPWGLRVIRQEIGVGIREQLASMQSGVVALVTMTLAILAVRTAFGDLPAGERLGASVVAGTVSYGATVLVLDRMLRDLVGLLLRRLIRRVRPHSVG